MIPIRQIPRLDCDLKFGLPVIAVLGVIYSLWASCFLLDALVIDYFSRWYRNHYLINPTINTYYFLSVATSIMLYFGFKNTDAKLIQYWRLLKLIECGFIIIGLIIFFFTFPWKWSCGYYPVAFVLLGAGSYLINTVQKGCIEMNLEVEPLTVSNLFKNFELKNEDSPPPYEENTQENINV